MIRIQYKRIAPIEVAPDTGEMLDVEKCATLQSTIVPLKNAFNRPLRIGVFFPACSIKLR